MPFGKSRVTLKKLMMFFCFYGTSYSPLLRKMLQTCFLIFAVCLGVALMVASPSSR